MTNQLFQCFVDLNLIQRRLEQDPGLRGPVGGLSKVLIKFEIIIFEIANRIQKHSGTLSYNIFYVYMEAQDPIQRNFQIMAGFMHARASKAPYQSGRSPKVVALFSATNFSSYIIESLQLQDVIQIQ